MEVNDTMADVKIKATLVYTALDPADFYLAHNHLRLMESDTIINIMNRTKTNGELVLMIKKSSSCCDLI